MEYDLYFNLGVTAILTVLKGLKGPDKKQKLEQLKKVFLKIYKGIKLAYAEDPDFE